MSWYVWRTSDDWRETLVFWREAVQARRLTTTTTQQCYFTINFAWVSCPSTLCSTCGKGLDIFSKTGTEEKWCHALLGGEVENERLFLNNNKSKGSDWIMTVWCDDLQICEWANRKGADFVNIIYLLIACLLHLFAELWLCSCGMV